MRRTGIEIIGDVPWGTHFCQFYRDKQDLIDILVPYFKEGLEHNEFCMWIASEPLGAEEATAALAGAVEGLDDYVRKGQIEILDYSQWYTLGGEFDADRVLHGWVEKVAAAQHRGLDGLRLSGNTFWLEKSGWNDFTEYEAKVDGTIGSYPMLAFCTYSLSQCGAAEIMDVVSNHAFALIKRGGRWEIIESAERKRMEVSLRENEERLHRLNRELEERVVEQERQREWLRVTLSSIGDAVLATDTAGRITFINPVAAKLTGWKEQEALSRPVRDVLRTINEETRQQGEDVIGRVVRERSAAGMANHTALITRDGREVPIEDSAAPIWDGNGRLAGVVLVFHDVTEERRAQQALRESEQRVRLKLNSILSPEGDIGRLELGDIIDGKAIQSLMEDLYRFARIPMAIIDLNGQVLVGVGWQDVCTRFHRVHPQACKNCIESDTQLTAGVPPGEFKLYKCKNNLCDVATPIMVGGQHVGNVFTGQFFLDDEPVDLELFRSQARRYGFDEAEYLAALARVPRLKREAVDAGMSFLTKLGHMVSLLSYSNLKLARSLAERDALTDSLKRAQEIGHLGSWELDLATNTLSWSDEVYRIFGVQPQEFAATYEAFLAAVHQEDRPVVDASYSDSLRDGRSYEITHRIVRGAGEVRWVHEKCEHVRDASGRIVRSIGMVQDITERKRAEDGLREAQKLESIGVLAGGIAHDFNNLLVGVIGNASLAEDMLPSWSPARDVLTRIIQAGEHAASLTRQMLAYAGKGRYILKPVDVSALIGANTALMQSSIPKKIGWEFRLQPDIAAVETDPSQMQQVIMNLVLNAGEAIGGDSGVISVATGETNLDSACIRRELNGWEIEPGHHVFIEVSDTGCGMDEPTRAKIFDPFFTTKFQGRGLGLAAVAGIVRAHRGAIALKTAPGKGSTFRVLLPAMNSAATRDPGGCEKEKEDLRGSGTVLIVDDEQVVRDVARCSLERQGYEVLLAADGPSAIEAIRDEGDRIQVVVLDLSMPGMSGEEALPHLRALKPDLDVILSSGYSQAEALRLFRGARLSGFIQKPYTVKELAREVKSAMASSANKCSAADR